METTPFSFGRHLIVALAIGVLAPFTLWAWPFAIATGIVIGTADVETAQALNIPLNAPIACVYRSVVDRAGCLVFVAEGIYRGDQVRIDMKLK